jgi:hypothetical protein
LILCNDAKVVRRHKSRLAFRDARIAASSEVLHEPASTHSTVLRMRVRNERTEPPRAPADALQSFAREHVADAGKAGLIGVALPRQLDDLEEAYQLGAT